MFVFHCIAGPDVVLAAGAELGDLTCHARAVWIVIPSAVECVRVCVICLVILGKTEDECGGEQESYMLQKRCSVQVSNQMKSTQMNGSHRNGASEERSR